jgi:hypothetical protein
MVAEAVASKQTRASYFAFCYCLFDEKSCIEVTFYLLRAADELKQEAGGPIQDRLRQHFLIHKSERTQKRNFKRLIFNCFRNLTPTPDELVSH